MSGELRGQFVEAGEATVPARDATQRARADSSSRSTSARSPRAPRRMCMSASAMVDVEQQRPRSLLVQRRAALRRTSAWPRRCGRRARRAAPASCDRRLRGSARRVPRSWRAGCARGRRVRRCVGETTECHRQLVDDQRIVLRPTTGPFDDGHRLLQHHDRFVGASLDRERVRARRDDRDPRPARVGAAVPLAERVHAWPRRAGCRVSDSSARPHRRPGRPRFPCRRRAATRRTLRRDTRRIRRTRRECCGSATRTRVP